MKKLLFSVLAVAAVAACSSGNTKTTLSGTVPEGTEQVMVQVRGLGVDTLITPVDGKYSIDLPVDKMQMGVVAIPDSRKYSQFIPDGNPITVNLDGEGESIIPSAKKGANIKLAEFLGWYDGFTKRFFAEDRNEGQEETLMDEYKAKLKEYAAEKSALGLNCVQSLVSMLEPSELRELVDGLAPEIKENESIVEMVKGLEAKEKTAVGQMFTDFEITQPDGTVKKLSDYVGKGKYILADFWASWCGPCRAEIPNIKNVYAKYHGDKFDIVSIAVWDKVEDTMKALEEEGLEWNQIIDCQRVPTDLYGIDGIPEIILFGPDGTILKRGSELRGAKMEPAIAEYLK